MAKAFGTEFMPEMAISWFNGSSWSTPEMVPSDSLPLHPATHALHYSSTCFEGLKAFRQEDGSVKIFRMDQNIARFAQSSRLLALPEIDEAATRQMILDVVAKFKDDVPPAPGSMYIRPTHFGTELSIGKAAGASDTSVQFVLLSPVGDYFAGGAAALRVLIDDQGMRCAPHMGMIKSGGNYASALNPIIKARADYNADQILFAPDGNVQETGAANFLLIDNNEIITKPLDESFLHGITRDSILTLARDNGLTVSERELPVSEVLERSQNPTCEAALAGTAAVLAPVGTFIYQDKEYSVGSGELGPMTRRLKNQLNAIQWGQAEDTHGWLTEV
ncbi:branched-chain amino acid aminotransferase [Leucothrix pacifica]|uniref:Branched-chain-amino-acid aminotransferase n=1 Tax=Leucothrix pacifica TaxID=1247513 RepID=A0A317CQ50_9GAMM|nr:branched-chain amino acid aminotransferase [Leucothrix pacifica]PWR00709.1 branched chain amino acid aminotransferase [Leucothrix pacifica]